MRENGERRRQNAFRRTAAGGQRTAIVHNLHSKFGRPGVSHGLGHFRHGMAKNFALGGEAAEGGRGAR